MWFMYVAQCKDKSYYCGVTTDVGRRISEHNDKKSKKGAKYTRSRRPVIAIFTEEHPTKSSALKAEARFKSLTREKKTRYMVDAIDKRLDDQMELLKQPGPLN